MGNISEGKTPKQKKGLVEKPPALDIRTQQKGKPSHQRLPIMHEKRTEEGWKIAVFPNSENS